jgi:hypothetical protein
VLEERIIVAREGIPILLGDLGDAVYDLDVDLDDDRLAGGTTLATPRAT